MHDGVSLADVFQELVAQAFTLGSPLDQAGDVREFKGRVDDLLGWDQFLDPGQAGVWHFNHPHVWFNRGEGVVCHFRPCLGDSVKQS